MEDGNEQRRLPIGTRAEISEAVMFPSDNGDGDDDDDDDEDDDNDDDDDDDDDDEDDDGTLTVL